MSKLGFQSKLGLLCVLIFLISGCRKELEHEEGTIISTEAAGWQKVSISIIEDAYAFGIYNGFLYIGGRFEYANGNVATILSYSSWSDTYYQVATANYIGGSIYDMELHNNYLYVAGDFNVSSSFSMLSIYRLGGFGTPQDVNFVDFYPMSIFHLRSMGDTLLVSGEFNYHPQFAPNITTKNVEFLLFDNPIGAADNPNAIYGSCVANNEIYVCGENGYFGYFTGQDWGVIEYPNKTANDVIYAIESIGSTIYLLGNFDDNVLIKTFNINTGTWSSVSSLGKLDTLKFGAGFKWIDNELYVFGNDLLSFVGGTTNIFKTSDGQSWKRVGLINEDVRDIIKYDGSLYAATPTGAYRLNP